jgi:hypothetical protein
MQKTSRPWLAGCRYAIASLSALGLSACGGGSGNNSASTGGGAQNYSLSASIQGLNSGGLVLLVNTAQVAVSSGATSISLASMLNSGTAYTVTVQTQPTGETCSVTNGSGTISTSNIANVVVNCAAATFTIGGAISGLSASGLVLLNNDGGATSIAANATQFVMEGPITYDGSYAITVKTPPGTKPVTAIFTARRMVEEHTVTARSSKSRLSSRGAASLRQGPQRGSLHQTAGR